MTTAEPTQATTFPVETLPPTVSTEATVTVPAVPDVSVEDVILYFNEVCLDAEMSASGNPSLLQKWDEPVLYIVEGSPTEEDLQTLLKFFDWLNSVEGFPGIYEAEQPFMADLEIYFCDRSEIPDRMESGFYGVDGAVTFWYNAENVIHSAVVCIGTDIDQQLRNSVIIEELYNGLGPVQDTALRPDSIIYQEYSEPQWLSPVDELLLRLLYHPDMRPGMNAWECEQVIRALYK